ncbi:hypothetical protein Acr_08g0005870 [Actinidia rufa]|uniref:Glutaredoxin family protein n=1 Tax=Actinidia rufa TaxID=165716 RepID=A0A7J0F0H3_9ERIC|nr:hypothetical protein Acr_08g0005870 [Actinidia rufa]
MMNNECDIGPFMGITLNQLVFIHVGIGFNLDTQSSRDFNCGWVEGGLGRAVMCFCFIRIRWRRSGFDGDPVVVGMEFGGSQCTLEKNLSLPPVFINGKHIGGADVIKQLHEVGELDKMLKGLPFRAPGLPPTGGGFKLSLGGVLVWLLG